METITRKDGKKYKLTPVEDELRYKVGDWIYISTGNFHEGRHQIESKDIEDLRYLSPYKGHGNISIITREHQIDHERTKRGRVDWSREGIYLGEESDIDHWYYNSHYDEIKECSCGALKGLAFQTEKQAQNRQDKMMAIKSIIAFKTRFDGEFVPDWSDSENKYVIYFDGYKEQIHSGPFNEMRCNPILPVFSSREIAEKCIEECKDSWNLLFDIEKDD